MVLARSGVQLRRARDEVAAARASGVGEDDLRLLSAGEARLRVGATDVLGGTFTPHCAALDPARLVRGLAEAVERRGVRHPRTDRGAGHPARCGGDGPGHGASGHGGQGHRGLHPDPAGRGAAPWSRCTR